jgi:hypothetical protein
VGIGLSAGAHFICAVFDPVASELASQDGGSASRFLFHPERIGCAVNRLIDRFLVRVIL